MGSESVMMNHENQELQGARAIQPPDMTAAKLGLPGLLAAAAVMILDVLGSLLFLGAVLFCLLTRRGSLTSRGLMR